MTSGPEGSSDKPQIPAEGPVRSVDSLLLESLIFVLIEKGVLTKNDALSAIGTAAQVRRGDDDPGGSAQQDADLKFLRQLYVSFENLRERAGVEKFDGENVHRLRPPVHCDRPEFPRDD